MRLLTRGLRSSRLLPAGCAWLLTRARARGCAVIPPFAADNDEESFILTLRGNYDKCGPGPPPGPPGVFRTGRRGCFVPA